MLEQNFTFASEADGLSISCLLVAPEGDARGTVLMAHGIAEYKERYLPMMRLFAQNGFACAINDHRGYGQSVRSDDDLGYTYEKGAEGTLRDMRTLGMELKKRYPGKKTFVFGHNMGALCAMNYLKQYGSELNGVILCGLPANNPAAGAGKQYLKLKKMVKGARYRDESVLKLMFSSYASKFKGETSPYCWINSVPEKIREYENDPKCGFLGTIDGYLSLLNLMTGAYDAKGWKNVNNMLPIFIPVGADDPCAEGEKGANAGEAYLKKLGFVRAESKAYPEARHEVHNDKNCELAVGDMLNRLIAWL